MATSIWVKLNAEAASSGAGVVTSGAGVVRRLARSGTSTFDFSARDSISGATSGAGVVVAMQRSGGGPLFDFPDGAGVGDFKNRADNVLFF